MPAPTHQPTWRDRVTDWRYMACLCLALLVAAVIIACLGSLRSAASARDSAAATREQLASSKDQITVLRQQRDTANARADNANRQADLITGQALDRIQGVTCAQWQTQRLTAVFAQLVYNSKNSTPEQKAAVAPFINPPKAPTGCGQVEP